MSNNNINIKYVQVNDHHKLGIIDRFIRTLRELINKYQSALKTTRYINILDELVDNYIINIIQEYKEYQINQISIN